MKKQLLRTLVLLLGSGVCAAGRSVYALDLSAYGTSTDAATQTSGKWEGEFHLEALRVSGVITASNLPGVTTAEIEGFADGDEIQFYLTQSTGLFASFQGRISSHQLNGTYSVAGHNGTWSGTWEPLRGAAAPEVPEVPQQTRTLPADGLGGPPVDPNDMGAKCRLLHDPDGVRMISGGGQLSLQDFCGRLASGTTSAGTTSPTRIAGLFSPFRALSRLWGRFFDVAPRWTPKPGQMIDG